MARGDIRGLVKRQPVASFFVLTYAISWLAWLPAMLGYQGSADAARYIIAQFGPSLAAFVIVFYTGASIRGWALRIVRWRASPRWYAVAFGLPAALIGLHGAVFGLLGYPLDLSSIPGRLVNFLPSAIILALIADLGEEPGWRGFASAAPQILLALLTMLTIFFYAFFYTWVYNTTRSVLLCMLLHGSFNAAIGLLPASFEALQRGTYVALLVVQNVSLLAAVAILIVATRGLLAYDAAPERSTDGTG